VRDFDVWGLSYIGVNRLASSTFLLLRLTITEKPKVNYTEYSIVKMLKTDKYDYNITFAYLKREISNNHP
jgi:hypothetical protein